MEDPATLYNSIAAETPMVVNLKPEGRYLLADLHRAEGIPAVMKEIEPLLHLDCLTVSGRTLGEDLEAVRCYDRDVVRPATDPIYERNSIVHLSGNLAPTGAVLKGSAASQDLNRHAGPATVFDGYADMLDRINSPELEVSADSVLVLRNVGPRGGPGMPEWGAIPILKSYSRKASATW
jgi:dihydroxy-acid dehydratase